MDIVIAGTAMRGKKDPACSCMLEVCHAVRRQPDEIFHVHHAARVAYSRLRSDHGLKSAAEERKGETVKTAL